MAKRVKSSSRPKSSTGKAAIDDSSSPILPNYFSKWAESDIANERWNADVTKGKDKQKWPFEDPLGLTPLPKSLETHVARWNRASGSIYAHMVSPNRFRQEPAFRVLSQTDKLWLRKKKLSLAPRTEEPWILLNQGSSHLLESSLMRELVTALSFLQRPPKSAEAHIIRPWELIYPRGKEGLPSLNPIGGKYVVKLFWLGHWRKVPVDDVIPFDMSGSSLLPQSSQQELWPAIICKAILRLASLSYNSSDTNGFICEAGNFSVVHTLTGWYPVSQSISPSCSKLVMYIMNELMNLEYSTLQDRISILSQLQETCTCSRLGQDKEDLVSSEVQSERVITPQVLFEEKDRDKDREKKTTNKQNLRSNSRSNISSRVGSGRSSVAEPGYESSAPLNDSRQTMFVTAYISKDKNTNNDLGLIPSMSHEVRILACHTVVLTGENKPRFILEMTSPLCFSAGLLGYSRDGDSKGWTKPLCIALGISLDRLRAEEQELMRRQQEQSPRPHFHFFMTSEEFFHTFSCIRVYHKASQYAQHAVLQHVLGHGVSLQHRRGSDDPTSTDFDPMEYRNNERWLLHVDNCEQSTILLHFAISPHIPRQPCLKPTNRSGLDLETVLEEPGDQSPRASRSSRVVDSLTAGRIPSIPSKSLDVPTGNSRPMSATDILDTNFEASSANEYHQPDKETRDGCVLVCKYKWDSVNVDNEPIVYLKTRSMQSSFCVLSPGRHILAIVTQHRFACSLSILSDQDITLSTASVVLPLLSEPSLCMKVVSERVSEIASALAQAGTLMDMRMVISHTLRQLQGLYPGVPVVPLWHDFKIFLRNALDIHVPEWLTSHEKELNDALTLIGQLIEAASPTLPAATEKCHLSTPSLIVQEHSSPNLLSNVKVMPNGTVRLGTPAASIPALISKPGATIPSDPNDMLNRSNNIPRERMTESGQDYTYSRTETNTHQFKHHNGSKLENDSQNSKTTAGHQTILNKPDSGSDVNSAFKSVSNQEDEKVAGIPSTEMQVSHTIDIESEAVIPDSSSFTSEEVETQHESAITLQKLTRGYISRLYFEKRREGKDFNTIQLGLTEWALLSNMRQHDRVIIDTVIAILQSPNPYLDLFYLPIVRDSDEMIHVQTATGDAEVNTSCPELLFDKRITVDEPCFVHFTLLVDSEVHDASSTLLDTPLSVSPALRILDCSTGRVVPHASGQTLPVQLQPHLQGYIILGWCSSVNHSGSIRWKLRVICAQRLGQDFLSDLKAPSLTDGCFMPVVRKQQCYPIHAVHLHVDAEIPSGHVQVSVTCDGQRLLREQVTAKGFFPLVLPSLLVNDIDAESGVLTDDSTEVDAKQKNNTNKSAKKRRGVSTTRVDTRQIQSIPKRVFEIVCELIGVSEDCGEILTSTNEKQRRNSKSAVKKSGPSVTIKASSRSKVEFSIDTREQDEIRQMVLGWEAAEPGRGEKAKATREKLKETVNVQEAAVVVPDPSEYNMTVLDAKLMHEREVQKQQKIREFRTQRRIGEEKREKESAERNAAKTRALTEANERRHNNQTQRENAGRLREIYRKAILDKLEAARAEEEKQSLKQEALEARVASSKPGRRKGKK